MELLERCVVKYIRHGAVSFRSRKKANMILNYILDRKLHSANWFSEIMKNEIFTICKIFLTPSDISTLLLYLEFNPYE